MDRSRVVEFPCTAERPEHCVMLGRICSAETSISDLKQSVGGLGKKLDQLTMWLMGATFSALLASLGWVFVLAKR